MAPRGGGGLAPQGQANWDLLEEVARLRRQLRARHASWWRRADPESVARQAERQRRRAGWALEEGGWRWNPARPGHLLKSRVPFRSSQINWAGVVQAAAGWNTKVLLSLVGAGTVSEIPYAYLGVHVCSTHPNPG